MNQTPALQRYTEVKEERHIQNVHVLLDSHVKTDTPANENQQKKTYLLNQELLSGLNSNPQAINGHEHMNAHLNDGEPGCHLFYRLHLNVLAPGSGLRTVSRLL